MPALVFAAPLDALVGSVGPVENGIRLGGPVDRLGHPQNIGRPQNVGPNRVGSKLTIEDLPLDDQDEWFQKLGDIVAPLHESKGRPGPFELSYDLDGIDKLWEELIGEDGDEEEGPVGGKFCVGA